MLVCERSNSLRCIFRAEVGTVFALSWLITWFGHVLSDFRHVVRLYDFFLACHPLMPIYFAAVVSSLQNKKIQYTLFLKKKKKKKCLNFSATDKLITVISALLCSRQIVLHREEEVLDCECDMAMVHHLLSQIPQDLPYETLISRAGDLFVQFPPSELAREAAAHER